MNQSGNESNYRIEMRNIVYEKDGPIATVILNRPEKLNAISHGPDSMHTDLVAAFKKADADDGVRCVVLTGAGRAFSTGGDMSHDDYAGRETALDWYLFNEDDDRDYTLIREMHKPVLAAINGLCYAEGLILAAHTDILVASEDARFGMIESRFGSTGIGVFPFMIGAQWSKFLMLTGELISANKAKEIGLVLEVIPRDIFMEKTYDLARRVAALPREGVLLNKRTIDCAMDIMGYLANKTSARASNAVADSMSKLAKTPDGRLLFDILREQGLKAFLHARDAPFKVPWLDG